MKEGTLLLHSQAQPSSSLQAQEPWASACPKPPAGCPSPHSKAIDHHLYMHLHLARSLWPSSSWFSLIFLRPLLPRRMASPSRPERPFDYCFPIVVFFDFLSGVFRQRVGQTSPVKVSSCDSLLIRDLAFFLVLLILMICVFLVLVHRWQAWLRRAHLQDDLATSPLSQIKNCQVDFTFPFLFICSNLRINL